MMTPKEIVDKMYNNDPFSQWLGIRRIEDGKGISILELEVRSEMCNGFGIAHGGIAYSLADSALAFAANSHGQLALSINSTISYLKPAQLGDVLKTAVEEIFRGSKNASYIVRVTNQKGELIAVVNGAVHLSQKLWFDK